MPPTETVGNLKVFPQYKIDFDGEFIIAANCDGEGNPVCTGNVKIQNYPTAKAARKHGSKLKVLANTSYRLDEYNNGLLSVAPLSSTAASKAIKKLDTLAVFVSPSNGGGGFYKIETI